jgi:hypothetical protein
MPNEEMFGWTEFGLIQDQSDFLQNQRKSCESVFNPAIGAYLGQNRRVVEFLLSREFHIQHPPAFLNGPPRRSVSVRKIAPAQRPQHSYVPS